MNWILNGEVVQGNHDGGIVVDDHPDHAHGHPDHSSHAHEESQTDLQGIDEKMMIDHADLRSEMEGESQEEVFLGLENGSLPGLGFGHS
jgi:hypothetical protein